MYALTEVPNCKIAPADTEQNTAEIQIYQKSTLKTVEAYECYIEYHSLRWHCGMHSHSSISRTHDSITRKLPLTGEECGRAVKKGFYTVDTVHWNVKWEVPMKIETESIITFADGKEKNGEVDCKGRGFVTYFVRYQQVQFYNLVLL